MYRYDLFVSYKREPRDKQLVTPWLREVLNRIEYWVRQEMGGGPVSIFFDEQSIEVGDDWPDELRDALQSAKCLLPVWSPEYFHSAWCVAEWKSFLLREKMMRERDDQQRRLIIPIRFHDGAWFPEEAKRVKQLDLSPYTATTRAFWESKRADELDQVIKDFAPTIATTVAKAPPYEKGWPVDLSVPGHPPKFVEMARI
jgi:TIR domain